MQESFLLSQNLTQTTKKLLASLSKKIENIEYLIKIEQTKMKEEEDSFKKESSFLSAQKEKSDRELTETIDELNEKEKKIYEKQKANLERFHAEILKFERVKADMSDQIKKIESDIISCQSTELISYNSYHMLEEDFQLTKAKLRKLKDTNEALFWEIKQIESTYPSQFSFLLNELTQSKNTTQLNLEIAAINSEIKSKEERKVIYSNALDFKSKRLIENETQLALQLSDNQFHQNENSVISLEKQIEKAMSPNNPSFPPIKDIIYSYFNSKSYHYELTISYEGLSCLIAALEKMRKEMQLTVNDLKLKAEMEGTKLQNMKYARASKHTSAKVNQFQISFDSVAHALAYLKEAISFIDQRIGKYKAICAIHIKDFVDSDYEKGLLRDLTALITSDLNQDQKEKLSILLDVYYENINEKLRTVFYLNEKIASLKGSIEKDKNDISALKGKTLFEDQELLANKTELNHLNNELLIVSESIGSKNKLLKPQLDKLTVEDFDKYLKANEAIYPKLNSRIKNNVLSIKKEDFIEQVIINHSAKKGKANECLEAIYSNKEVIARDELVIKALEPRLIEREAKHKEDRLVIEGKHNEIEVLERSIELLNKQINEILEAQTEAVVKEKKVLQIQDNIPFYLNRIRGLTERIGELTATTKIKLEEYENNKRHHQEREGKLNSEVSELKEKLSKLLSLNMPSFNQTQISLSALIGATPDDTTKRQETNEDVLNASKQSLPGKINPNDPFIQVSLNNLSHLTSGLSLYKKLNQKPSVCSKIPVFTLKDSIERPPEKCGYAIRFFRINPVEEHVLIQNPKTNIIEAKMPFETITGLLVDLSSKHIISRLKGNEHSLLTNGEYIQFTLLLKEGSVDVIAPSYSAFDYFQMGIDEIIKNKKKIKQLSKYMTSSPEIDI